MQILSISPVHLHLLVNHSVFLYVLLGLFVFLYGVGKPSKRIKKLGVIIIILGCIGAGISDLSGTAAKNSLKFNNSFQTVEKVEAISKHEEIASLTLLSSILLLGISLIYLFTSISHLGLAVVLVISSIATIYFAALTGHSGGKISHTEAFETNGN